MKRYLKRYFCCLGCLSTPIILFLLLITFPIKKERVYVCPAGDLYIRIECYSWVKSCKVYFGKDETSVYSSSDYIKVLKAGEMAMLNISYKALEDTIFLESGRGILEIKQTNFLFHKLIRPRFDMANGALSPEQINVLLKGRSFKDYNRIDISHIESVWMWLPRQKTGNRLFPINK